MATWYVDSTAVGANNGTSKANAWTTLGAAFTGVTVAGDSIWVSHLHDETLGATATYTVGANHSLSSPLSIECRNFSTDAVATGAVVGKAAFSINFAGVTTASSIYGIEFRITGTGNQSINLCTSQNQIMHLEACTLSILTTGASAAVISGLSNRSTALTTRNCTFKWGNAGQAFAFYGKWVSYGDNYSGGATHPTSLVDSLGGGSGSALISYGGDFSNITNIVKYTAVTDTSLTVHLFNPKLKAGFGLSSSPSAVWPGWEVFIYDGSADDNHFNYLYGNYLGSLLCDSGIYVNDNICDVNLSWKISTTANSHHNNPFITPPISIRHTGASAVTPYVECLRAGSTVAYDDQKLWSLWSYKGTSGSTKSTIVNDRCAVDGTPTAQASSSKTAVDWTGEDATNNWFGKLGPSSSITPAEAGDIFVQIAFGEPSSVIYVDPQIRGL